MYVEIVSGGQPFTAGRVCFLKKIEFCPLGSSHAALCIRLFVPSLSSVGLQSWHSVCDWTTLHTL